MISPTLLIRLILESFNLTMMNKSDPTVLEARCLETLKVLKDARSAVTECRETLFQLEDLKSDYIDEATGEVILCDKDKIPSKDIFERAEKDLEKAVSLENVALMTYRVSLALYRKYVEDSVTPATHVGAVT